MTALVKDGSDRLATVRAGLPLRPLELAQAALGPIERGELYNDLNLCCFQRRCIEEALRLVAAGEYPEAGA